MGRTPHDVPRLREAGDHPACRAVHLASTAHAGKDRHSRATFSRWYDLYRTGGPDALNDRHPKPDRVWNRIPDHVRERIVRLALDESALSPTELAVRFT